MEAELRQLARRIDALEEYCYLGSAPQPPVPMGWSAEAWGAPNRRLTYLDLTRAGLPHLHRQFANSSPLALLAFGIVTLMLGFLRSGIPPQSFSSLVWSQGLFVGGLAQLLAAFWDTLRNETFGLLTYSMLALYWLSFAFYSVFVELGVFQSSSTFTLGRVTYYAVWSLIAALLASGSLAVNRLLAAKFTAISSVFLLLLASSYTGTSLVVGGYLGFLDGLIALYLGSADLSRDIYEWRRGLPAWPTRQVHPISLDFEHRFERAAEYALHMQMDDARRTYKGCTAHPTL